MPPTERDPGASRRVRRTTARWQTRLIAAVLGSLALHASPLLVVLAVRPKPLDLDYTIHTVEIGFEQARPGAATPPPPATPPALAPAPPASTPPAHPARPSAPVHHEPPTHGPRDTADTMPLPSHAPPRAPERPAALATPPALAPHATASSAGLPTVAQAASEMASLVPRGALVTLLLRSDHLRGNPDAVAVRRLLQGIPDWNLMLGGSDLDPVRDLDTLVLAASQPFGTREQPPDWFVVAKGRDGSDARLRRAIERMALPPAARAPSPIAPPPLDGGVDDLSASDAPDGGRLAAIWRTGPGGHPLVTLDRYYARRDFVLLGDGMAAIAMPGQVDRLAAAMARRPTGPIADDDPSLVLLVQADGVRNLVTVGTWRGPFPMPSRFALALRQMLDAQGHADGAATLDAELQYDAPADAEQARTMFEYARTRWHVMIATQLGARGGLGRMLAGAVAGMAGIDVDALEASIDALEFRASGDRVVVHARFTATQIRGLLNAASVGAGE